MPSNKPTSRNRLDYVPPGTQRGDVVEIRVLAPEVVEVLTDNPDGGQPITVWKRMPGQRAVVRLSGWRFVFTVRVVENHGHKPRVVDLRIGSPVDCDDVPITNIDMKAVPLARIAAAVASGLLTSGEKVFDPERWAAPEQYTDEARGQKTRTRGRGRPRKLTDEFLTKVAQFARTAHANGEPIVPYIAANIEPDPKRRPRPDTVRWWLAEARKPERGFLTPGELMGKRSRTTDR